MGMGASWWIGTCMGLLGTSGTVYSGCCCYIGYGYGFGSGLNYCIFCSISISACWIGAAYGAGTGGLGVEGGVIGISWTDLGGLGPVGSLGGAGDSY